MRSITQLGWKISKKQVRGAVSPWPRLCCSLACVSGCGSNNSTAKQSASDGDGNRRNKTDSGFWGEGVFFERVFDNWRLAFFDPAFVQHNADQPEKVGDGANAEKKVKNQL